MKQTQLGRGAGVPDNTALFVVGHRAAAEQRKISGPLSIIGRVLLSSPSRWDVHRHAAGSDGARVHSALDVLREVDRFTYQAARRFFFLVTGELVDVAGEPALIVDSQWQDHPTLTTLALSTVGERIRRCRAEAYGVVLLVKRPSSITQATLLNLFAPEPDTASFVVVGDWPKEGDPTLLANLAQLLSGEVGDGRRTGVTVAMITDILSQHTANTTYLAGQLTDYVWNLPPSGLDSPSRAGETALERPNRVAALEPDDLTGQLLPGNIHIDGLLGIGGFAKVYFGRQLGLGARPVAVKVLDRKWDGHPSALNMFASEIAAIALVDSPNVVRIYYRDITAGGRFFYVMERLNGQTLRNRLRMEPPLHPDQIHQIGHGIFSGLAAIAAMGVVHRDVKPENIMLCDSTLNSPFRVVLLDFGIAMLQGKQEAGDGGADAAGTPDYMAPEQFEHHGRVDERTDLFQAGLVIFEMLTGWQRPKDTEELPPIDELMPAEAWWPRFLKKCLAADPDQRFSSAAQCLSALTEGSLEVTEEAPPRFASRLLLAYSEKDRFRFFGRTADTIQLTDRILYHSFMVLSAPSGMGKSSLLRASVVPKLKEFGRDVVYISCRLPLRKTLVHRLRTDPALQLFSSPTGTPDEPAATAPTTTRSGIESPLPDLEQAIVQVLQRRQRGLVLILDQAESVLTEDDQVFDELVMLSRRPDLGLSVVLGIRDDALGVLLAHHEWIRNEYEPFQIGLLPAEAGQRVLEEAFQQSGQTVDTAVSAIVIDALMKDGTALAKKLRWPRTAGIYPPHLQIVTAALLERATDPDGQKTWLQKGEFPLQTLLDDHVESVLHREFDKSELTVCASLFAELTVDFERRRSRTGQDLMTALADSADETTVRGILETLVRYRILMPITFEDGQVGVEITHDSLLKMLVRWVNTQDLGRRRAKEILRYHLHRRDNGVASYLSREESAEVEAAPDAISSLDEERVRLGLPAGGAKNLFNQSSRRYWRRVGALVGAGVLVLALAGGWMLHSTQQEMLRLANIGRFPLDVAMLDLDGPDTVITSPVTDFPELTVAIRQPADRGWFGFGPPFDPEKMNILPDPEVTGRFWVEGVGGQADIVVSGRHRAGQPACAPSILRRANLPGVNLRDSAEAQRRLVIPSCAISTADLVWIPAGKYESGAQTHDGAFPERTLYLSEYAIDPYEVSNLWFSRYIDSTISLVGSPNYHEPSGHADWQNHPKVQISWPEALAYCEWMGKTLPTAAQAEKAGRGGIWLDGDIHAKEKNPFPRRKYPSGDRLIQDDGRPNYAVRATDPPAAGPNAEPSGFSAVGMMDTSRSEYGVYHLIGNASEWRADAGRIAAWKTIHDSVADPRVADRQSPLRYMEPSNYTTTNREQVLLSAWDAVDLDNRRGNLGFRCATRGSGSAD